MTKVFETLLILPGFFVLLFFLMKLHFFCSKQVLSIVYVLLPLPPKCL